MGAADHRLYAGMLGWHDKPLIELSETADVIATFGLDGADLMVPYKGSAQIVNLAPLGGDPRAFQPVAASVAGELAPILSAVARAAGEDREWGEAQAKQTRDAIDELMSVSSAHDPATVLRRRRSSPSPGRLCPRTRSSAATSVRTRSSRARRGSRPTPTHS